MLNLNQPQTNKNERNAKKEQTVFRLANGISKERKPIKEAKRQSGYFVYINKFEQEENRTVKEV